MMLIVIVVCLSVIVQVAYTSDSKLPSFLKICHRNDPALNECVRDSLEILRPMLVKGIPELMIPPCDPLHVPELVVREGHGAVAVDYSYNDVIIKGASKFKLHSLDINLEKNTMRLNLTLPQLQIAGNYTISGQILMLPIYGTGYSNGNYSDIEASALIQWDRVTQFGKVYLHVASFTLNFTIGHASVKLTDLFNGDDELGDAMNMFINENWKKIAEDITPVLEKTFGEMLKTFTNKIFHAFTMDELLPP